MSAIRHRLRERKEKKTATLNLVSLMDIFTILVFFLMVNSSEVEMLETASDIKLPDSVSEERPEERLSILVSEDTLIVQGKAVASTSEALSGDADIIEGLAQELAHQRDKRLGMLANPEDFEGAVTIMGDKALPYALLKRVMLTCQQNDFTRIALAVNQVEGAS